jgi:stage V sporulation protein SpoVS
MLRCRRPNDRQQESDRVTVRSRVASLAPGAGFGLVIVVVFVLLALGSAGLITAVDRLPGAATRPELTWPGDEAIRPGLDAATTDLEAMTKDIDRLGELGRGALAALASSKWDLLDSTVADGAVLVSGIRDRTVALRARLLALPGLGRTAETRLSQASLDRQQRLFDALDATDGLATAWARLAAGGINAAQLSTLLTRHDGLITHAIDAGLKRQTQPALASIDQATATLDQAAALRDRLANSVDVSELNEWLRRNRNYDAALRRLYVASAASPNRVSPELRAASDAELAARKQLPGDTSGLVIIMAEIGRGGLNQAVLAIELARGSLADVVDAEAAAAASSPSSAP